jgi:phosphoribosylanthranilate isomerase
MTWIKVCGLTTVEDALAAEAAGADAIGLVFAESPRSVSLERAREIARRLAPETVRVGVFVNAGADRVLAVARGVPLDWVQLHGDECRTDLDRLDRPAVKAFRARGPGVLDEIRAFGAHTFLLDGWSSRRRGGTGVRVDPALAVRARKLGFMILAGGLDPGNVAEAILLARPAGVDVSSGVERRPGRKDPGKMREFISEVRRCDARMNGATSALSGAGSFRKPCSRP